MAQTLDPSSLRTILSTDANCTLEICFPSNPLRMAALFLLVSRHLSTSICLAKTIRYLCHVNEAVSQQKYEEILFFKRIFCISISCFIQDLKGLYIQSLSAIPITLMLMEELTSWNLYRYCCRFPYYEMHFSQTGSERRLKHRALGMATLNEKVMKKERQENAKADKMEEVDHRASHLFLPVCLSAILFA
ncbi:hypothetical protein DV515_00006758 [Chloebia gouldiae]|uniref:Uncharacterized protein n=1 Tax=Chloebia gouldiae TaxID=44316 RepID=A0A3L8SK94_CHLGU|nr:hypothetical protein DV515_00006758 [Chloebia gouldiae]